MSTTVESLSGSGELRVAGAHLAKVFYHLRVHRANPAEDPAVGLAGDVGGGWDITGEVTISQDEPMQAQVMRRMGSGEALTLHLGDGRQLEVYAAPAEAVSGVYRIVPVSPAAGFQNRWYPL